MHCTAMITALASVRAVSAIALPSFLSGFYPPGSINPHDFGFPECVVNHPIPKKNTEFWKYPCGVDGGVEVPDPNPQPPHRRDDAMPPDWPLIDPEFDSGYRIEAEFADGADFFDATSSLSSNCHDLLAEGHGTNINHLKFDSGWIETNFFLYSDNKCENQIFKGYIGNYDVSIRGMVVGSIRAD